MALELEPAVTTIDLRPDDSVIELDGLPIKTLVNYQNPFYLVNQNQVTLVNQDGDILICFVPQTLRTNIVDLGA